MRSNTSLYEVEVTSFVINVQCYLRLIQQFSDGYFNGYPTVIYLIFDSFISVDKRGFNVLNVFSTVI